MGTGARAAPPGGTVLGPGSTFAMGTVGAPSHFHTKATEIFFVLSGPLQALRATCNTLHTEHRNIPREAGIAEGA